MFHCSAKILFTVSEFTVDCIVLHCGCTVSAFTVNYTVWQGCGWAGGQVRQPGGKPPSPWSARPWALGQTKSAHGALAATPTSRPPKRRVTLDFLSLGCSPSTTWRLGCLYF